MFRPNFTRWLCLALLLPDLAHAAVWELTYPQPSDEENPLNQYPIQLLHLALAETGVKYRLLPSRRHLEQGQAIKSLAAAREISVLWSMTDASRESQLRPIRIPIYKGLIGLRLFLVGKDNVQQVATIDSLTGLRTLKMVQGKDWPDTKILQFNGFDVVSSAIYDKLFGMLNDGQAQLFPRSVVEIWLEQDTFGQQYPIEVEQSMGIYYPTAVYFFVNKKNTVLANLLQTGLEKALADGTFDELFERHYRGYLDNANLTKRSIFELENPVLPAGTPLNNKALWYPVNTIKLPAQ